MLSPVHTSNMSKQHVKRCFDMLLRHVAGVDGALVVHICETFPLLVPNALQMSAKW